MENINVLLDTLRNTTDIKKVLKTLKKIKFNELSPNVLMEIKNIISNKNYVQVKKRVSKYLNVLSIIGIVIGSAASLRLGFLMAPLITCSINALIMVICMAIDKALLSEKTREQHISSIKQYEQLLEQMMLNPEKSVQKSEKIYNDNNLELMTFIPRARLIIQTNCSEKDKELYNKQLNDMLKVYYEKISLIDSSLTDMPNFVQDYKNLCFRALQKQVEQLIISLNSPKAFQNRQIEDLVDSLNSILKIDNLNEQLLEFIKLSNALSKELIPENIGLNLQSITLIAQYYIILIQQNCGINLKWLLPQINSIFYDAILNELVQKLAINDNLEMTSIEEELQHIENLSCAYIINYNSSLNQSFSNGKMQQTV